MTNTPFEPLVEGTREAATHFAKAAYEVAAGVGSLLVAITRAVRQDPDVDREGDEGGRQRVTVE